MVYATSFLNLLGTYIIVVLLPLLAFYIGYLILSRAFHEMGFSSWEAIIIVFVSFFLGSGLADGIAGIRFSNISLFTYNTYWVVGINVGGALIPILLSIYLSMKNKLPLVRVFFWDHFYCRFHLFRYVPRSKIRDCLPISFLAHPYRLRQFVLGHSLLE